MTVRRNSENRNGATLILSEEELEYLWHRLNASDAVPFNEYMIRNKLSDTNIRTIVGRMWSVLDRRYRPANQ